jgi:murein L,D-transpeptidase YcbB/YkuD
VFERVGLEVKRGPDGNINVVQSPGAANALGRIKFNFPNKFQVYLHDRRRSGCSRTKSAR